MAESEQKEPQATSTNNEVKTENEGKQAEAQTQGNTQAITAASREASTVVKKQEAAAQSTGNVEISSQQSQNNDAPKPQEMKKEEVTSFLHNAPLASTGTAATEFKFFGGTRKFIIAQKMEDWDCLVRRLGYCVGCPRNYEIYDEKSSKRLMLVKEKVEWWTRFPCPATRKYQLEVFDITSGMKDDLEPSMIVHKPCYCTTMCPCFKVCTVRQQTYLPGRKLIGSGEQPLSCDGGCTPKVSGK